MDGIYNFRLVVSCSEPLLQKVLHSHLALGQDIGCVLQMNALLINNILGICFLTQIVIFILSILTFKPLASIIKFQSFHWFKRSSYVSFIMTSSTPSSYHDIMTSSSYVSFIMTSSTPSSYHDIMTSSSYVSFIMTSSTQ